MFPYQRAFPSIVHTFNFYLAVLYVRKFPILHVHDVFYSSAVNYFFFMLQCHKKLFAFTLGKMSVNQHNHENFETLGEHKYVWQVALGNTF